jgi:hypothetical protein
MGTFRFINLPSLFLHIKTNFGEQQIAQHCSIFGELLPTVVLKSSPRKSMFRVQLDFERLTSATKSKSLFDIHVYRFVSRGDHRRSLCRCIVRFERALSGSDRPKHTWVSRHRHCKMVDNWRQIPQINLKAQCFWIVSYRVDRARDRPCTNGLDFVATKMFS